jgi:hypothetical protein
MGELVSETTPVGTSNEEVRCAVLLIVDTVKRPGDSAAGVTEPGWRR